MQGAAALLLPELVDAPAVLGMGGEPGVGEEIGEVVVFATFREGAEQVGQVGLRLDLVGFATGQQAEEDRGAAAAGLAADEEPILAADGANLDRAF